MLLNVLALLIIELNSKLQNTVFLVKYFFFTSLGFGIVIFVYIQSFSFVSVPAFSWC